MRLTGLWFLAILGVIGCSGPTQRSDSALEQRIAAEVAKGPGTVVDLAEIVPGDWTTLQIFTPYTPPAVVDSVLGFEWEEGRHERLEYRDDINILAFAKHGTVVRYVALPRHLGDFCCLMFDASDGRHAAKFIVVTDGLSSEGRPWFRLRQITAPAG